MSTRNKQMTMYATEEEAKMIKRMIMELSLKDGTMYSVSDWLRKIVLNGNAPPPDIIDDCVKEKIAEMEAEDDKQDDEQVPTKDPEPVVNPFDGINLGDM